MEPLTAGLAGLVGRWLDDPEVALIFVREFWPDIAGPQLSQRVVPVRIEGGCLWLEVTDAEWRQVLREMIPELQSRIDEVCGIRWIERIRVETRLDGEVDQRA